MDLNHIQLLHIGITEVGVYVIGAGPTLASLKPWWLRRKLQSWLLQTRRCLGMWVKHREDLSDQKAWVARHEIIAKDMGKILRLLWVPVSCCQW